MRKYINRRALNRLIAEVKYAATSRTAKRSFAAIAEKYKKEYLAYTHENTLDDRFVIPLWQELTNDIERQFLAGLPMNFLSHPVVRRTMFVDWGGQLQDEQLAFLKTQFGDRLRRLLAEHPSGNPTITSWRYKASHNTIHHLSHLARWSERSGENLFQQKYIVEWGGGYGNMARVYRKINPDATYTIIDIPVFAFIQATYLSSVFGEDAVRIITNPTQQIAHGKINIIPLNEKLLGTLSDLPTDLFISTWALSESTAYAQELVARHDYFGADHLLLAHQERSHEIAYSENIMNHLGHFEIYYHEKIPRLKNNYYLFAKKKLS